MIAHNRRLLLVDKDSSLLAHLADHFAPYGFAMDSAPCAPLMRERLARDDYALVVLDTQTEDGPGLLRELAIERRLPVIVHSAACSDAERIAALEMGAEDCIGKPANPRELLARIRAALRGRADTRTGTAPRKDSPLAFAAFEGWRVDMTTGQLFNPVGAPIALSDGEFQLLRVFVQHPREVLDRARLLDQVYGSSSDHYDRSIDVQLCRLRRKLTASGLKGPVIRTIRNEGYMFVHSVTN